jgi:protein TonB
MRNLFSLLTILLFSSFSFTQVDTTLIIPDPEPREKFLLDSCSTYPEFPGGEKKMLEFIMQNIIYPNSEKENGVVGSVYIEFVIDEEGNPTEVKIARTSGSRAFDDEAIRVIKSMPQWIPGKNCLGNVKVKYSIPIHFKLN